MAAVNSLRAALESERSSLQQIDASIKRIVQSHHDRQYHLDRSSFNSSGDGGRVGGRYPPRGAELPEAGRGGGEEGGKRKHETKTVFSRLSVRHDGDSDPEESPLGKRPRISSQVTRDLPSKQEIMKAQCGDEQSKVRNRRMFGSLLGTLQKFKQEEMVLKSKEDKRAQVERRIEQQAIREKENQRRERQTLFADRELKKATIKALEAKLARAAEFETWAEGQRTLGNFIVTRTRPHVHWLPRRTNPAAAERLAASSQRHHKYMEKKRQELEEELVRIEQKCLRSVKGAHNAAQFAASKENKTAEPQGGTEGSGGEEPSRRKREKFVSEVRVKEENGTVLKMEGDRVVKEQREKRVSKDNTEEREHCETRESEQLGSELETQREEPETPEGRKEDTEEEEGDSERHREERVRRDTEPEEAEAATEAAQNGSPRASPNEEKLREDGENENSTEGGSEAEESPSAPTPAPPPAASPRPAPASE